MAEYKHKNGTGTLFYNEKKSSEKHPDMKGTLITPDGVEYRVSVWKKSGMKGEFFSMALDQWQGGANPGASNPNPNPNPIPANGDSGLPF